MADTEKLTVEQMRSALASRPGDEDAARWKDYVAALSPDEVRTLYAKAEKPQGR
jgi:hypothetical protein